MKKYLKLEAKRAQKKLLEEKGPTDSVLRFLRISKEGYKRMQEAERSDRFSDVLCSECRQLVKLSKFDTNVLRISIPDLEEDEEFYFYWIRLFLIDLKIRDEQNGRPLTGQDSRWKKNAAKLFYGEYNKVTAKQVDRLVRRIEAYTPTELSEMKGRGNIQYD